ncbi:TonB-dependent receptor plug domain-containing protein [Paraglaciecola sp.]|uniref:TonB-dependent receptor plug domain-containing protein n=1 Tax=Paraglaciecola sp. TaxID=1920173 RepID=UPI003EF9EED4
MKNSFQHKLFGVTFFICMNSALASNIPAQMSLFDLSLAELLSVEITGATLQRSTLQKVPAAVTVITKKQINLYGFSDLSSLLNYVSGYQVQRSDVSSFGQTISSRSLKANSSAREILVLVDGQRLNDDWTGGATHLLAKFPLNHVERVEVIKGAGSALYGSNAYAGVINIVTAIQNETSVSISQHGGARINGQFNHLLEEGYISAFASVDTYHGEEVKIYDPFTTQLEDTRDPFQSNLFYIKGSWKNIELNISHQKNQSEQFYAVGFVSNPNNYLSMTQEFIRLKHQTVMFDHWKIKTQLFMSKHKYEVTGKIAPTPIETYITGQVLEQDQGFEISASYSVSTQENILIGIEYRQPKLTNTDANTSGALNLYLPQALTTGRKVKGVFFQYQNTLFENIEYILGVRQDNYNDFGTHFSPRIGINWQVNPQQVVKVLYGNSFRAPNRLETGVMNSNAFTANPNLQPEIFSTFDLIWQYSANNTLFSIDVFYNEVDDGVRQLQTTPIQFTNDGTGSSTGVELELAHTFNEQWQVKFNLMTLADYDEEFYTDSKTAANIILSYSADNVAYSLLAHHQSKKLDADASIISYSVLKPRTCFEIHAQWSLTQKSNVKVGVSNVFDQTYYGTASRADIIGGVVDRGRNINLTYQRKF